MSKCDCGYSPTVIIPGIGQSKVDLIDEKGNRIKSAWPLNADTSELMSGIKSSFLKMMMFRRDMGFSDKLADIVKKVADPIASTDEGVAKNRLRVISYPYSVAKCNEEEKTHIYKMVPLEGLAEIIGEDHLYFYAYHSFGSVYGNADGLHDFIQMVKAETGHDKVNIIPVSLGGAVSTAYFDAYGHLGDIDKVLYFVAALDGTQVIGDLLTDNIHKDDIGPLLQEIAGGGSKGVADVFKMVPAEVLKTIIDKLITAISDTVLLRSTMMWSIIPCHLYEGIRDQYIQGKKFNVLRDKTDRFHKAHKNLKDILTKQMEMGVEFYNICGYGRQLPRFVCSETMSSDGMINISSASLGGYATPLGESLPEDYVQQNTYCKDSTHNHISPDRTLDASTGFFPETTWYFSDQVHDDTAFNDIALKIAEKVLTEDNFKSVFCDERYPQFNKARNIKKIKYDLLPKAKNADRSKLFPGQIEVLDNALSKADAMMANTLEVSDDEVREVEKLLAEAVDLITSDDEA